MKNFMITAVLATILPLAAHATDDLVGNAENGEAVYSKCMLCHMVGEDSKNKNGPTLNGVVGRAAGTVEDFKYSKALRESGLIWDESTLGAYLENPRKFLKGNRMAFPGVKDPQDLADLIAFLKLFNSDGTKM